MEVTYLPYFLVFANLDSDTSRRHGHGNGAHQSNGTEDSESHLESTLTEFTTLCWTRKCNFEKLVAQWSEGRQSRSGQDLNLPKWLYHPICYQPLNGHSDAFAIVGVDDFDAYHYLSTVSGKIAEDLTVMLCPDMTGVRTACEKKFKGSALELEFCESLSNVESFWDKAATPEIKAESKAEGHLAGCPITYSPTVPPEVEKRPLCAISRCKLEGIFAIDLAGRICEELLVAIGNRVVSDLAELSKSCEESPALYTIDDLRSVRVTFLHSQGTNELNVLIHGTNPTVLGCMMSSFRALMFGDVFSKNSEEGKAICGLLDSPLSLPQVDSNKHPSKRDWNFCDSFLCLKKASEHQEKSFDLQSLLFQTPLLRWTLSSIGVATDGRELCTKTLTGYLSADALFQFTPAGEDASELVETTSNPSAAPNFANVYPHLLGLYDDIRPLSDPKLSSLIRNVEWKPTVDIAEWIWGHHANLSQSESNKGAVGLSCLVSVPVPTNWKKAIGERKGRQASVLSSTLQTLLSQARQSFLAPIPKLEGQRSSTTLSCAEWCEQLINQRKGGLHSTLRVHLIQEIPKLYGLPLALRHSITCLFQQYLSALTNVHLFDLVTDLLDAFTTFHHVLCQILPRHLLGQLDEKGIWVTYPIQPEAVQRIANYAEALHRSMDHRLHRAYPESPLRDMAVDLRGDLYGFIQAAEAPMKCGVGMVNETSCWATEHRRRDILGVFTTVGFAPGICSVPRNLGIEDKARLGFFATDVPHLMHVGAYVDYLHEAAHVTLQTMISHRSQLGDRWPVNPTYPHKERSIEVLGMLAELDTRNAVGNRLHEVFVHALTYMLLCPGERLLFLRYFVSRFSAAPENSGQPLVGTVHQFAEVFSVLYLGTLVVDSTGNTWKKREFSPEDYSIDLGDFEEDFDAVFNEVAWWYGPYEHAASEDARSAMKSFVREHLLGWLQNLSNSPAPSDGGNSAPTLCDILNLSWLAFRMNAEKVISKRDPSLGGFENPEAWIKNYQTIHQEVGNDILEHVNSGRVFHIQYISQGQDNEHSFILHDAMLVCGLLLRAYLQDMSECNGGIELRKNGRHHRRINIPQMPGHLEPHIDANVMHEDFVLLHGAGTRVFLNVEQREKRMLRQISVLRSFWSMAAVFKGRRLCDVLRFAGLLDDLQSGTDS